MALQEGRIIKLLLEIKNAVTQKDATADVEELQKENEALKSELAKLKKKSKEV